MAKKKAPTREQLEVLKAHGLKDYLWEVQQELPESLIVRHRITGEFRMIDKKGEKV